MTTLHCTPLDSKLHEIRLLVLEPDSWIDDIRCHLKTVALDYGPDYETLSYVWGDALTRLQILVDGLPTFITTTSNLLLEDFAFHKTTDHLG
jgi:hypothetical protein